MRSAVALRRAHAALLLDRAGWHTTPELDVPGNMTLIFLPSRAPELNPVECLAVSVRELGLNRVFDGYDAIIDTACAAWQKNFSLSRPQSLYDMRDWANISQL
jgi:hypothetical protein